jgi:hypothetical protein
VAALLDRRTSFQLSISDRELYLSLGGATYSSPVIPYQLT